jgi:hypothetical protein
VVLLVGEAERPLHLGRGVDEAAQGVSGKRVVVAARRGVLELPGLEVAALRVAPLEDEALDLVGDVRDHVLLLQLRRQGLQPRAQVRGVGRTVLVAHVAKDEDLARPEHVGREPVEGRPVDREPQVGLGMPREAADRRAVEGEVVEGLQQELLVVVQHVETAFEVGEAHGHRLDALLVAEVLDPLLPDLAGVLAGHAVGLAGEVHLLQLVVRDLEKVAKRRFHSSPLLAPASVPARGRAVPAPAGLGWSEGLILRLLRQKTRK